MSKKIRIRLKETGELIAEGEKGWNIFPFEGNYYISKKALVSEGFKMSWIPGICPYKFLYFWYHFVSSEGKKHPMLAWKYWLPNPIFPFIAFRIAVPASHPELIVEEV